MPDPESSLFPEDLDAPVSRLVSLVPSLTAALIDLGRGDRIVGRTAYCPGPPEAAVVGGTKNPKIHQIVSLRPDLVLAVKEENPAEAVLRLREAGVPVVVFDPRRVEETPALLWILGKIVRAGARAGEMAGRLAESIAAAREESLVIRPVRTAYLVWRDPWMVAGPDTFIADVLRTCGLAGCLEGGTARYPRTSPRLVVEAGAELVLFSSEPYAFGEKDIAEFRRLAGLEPESGPVLMQCRGDLVGWYPSRTAEALNHLREIRAGLKNG